MTSLLIIVSSRFRMWHLQPSNDRRRRDENVAWRRLAVASSPAFLYELRVHLKNEVTMKFCRVRRWFVRSMFYAMSVAALGTSVVVSLAPSAFAQSFPFGHELRLDANPMRGSKRV